MMQLVNHLLGKSKARRPFAGGVEKHGFFCVVFSPRALAGLLASLRTATPSRRRDAKGQRLRSFGTVSLCVVGHSQILLPTQKMVSANPTCRLMNSVFCLLDSSRVQVMCSGLLGRFRSRFKVPKAPIAQICFWPWGTWLGDTT